MNTKRALEQLESVRPDSDDLSAPEFQAAAATVEADADLELAFHQRLNADRRIGEVMQNVDVPDGLKERLLAAVHDATDPVIADAAEKPGRRRSPVMWITVAAAIVAVGMLGVWLSDSSRLTLADLENMPVSASEIDALPVFTGFSLAESSTVKLLAPRTGHSWNSTGTDTAVFQFTCSKLKCVLVVVPSGSADPGLTPARTVTLHGRYAMSGWREAGGTLVCVLLVEGNSDDLREVESVLRGALS